MMRRIMSRRRFYWLTVALLASATCVLVRPMRSWLDQAMVTMLVNRSLSVAELHVHSSDQVIEVRQLAWGNTTQDRSFGLEAERAWFAFDPVPLVDRQWDMANVVLEDARLYLRDAIPEHSPQPSIWQQGLAQHVAQLDWNELRQHFGSLLAADGLTKRWDERIEQWLLDSEAIMTRSREVDAEVGSLDNPLRYEDDVRKRLAEVDALRAKQERLMDQFDGLRRLLDAESQRLDELFQADREWLAEHGLGFVREAIRSNHGDPTQADAELERLADELLQAIALKVWHRYGAYMEVSARVTDGPNPQPLAAADRNIRDSRGALVALRNVSATGVFELREDRIPFALSGRYQQIAHRDQQQKDYFWQFDFQPVDGPVRVAVVQARSDALRRISLNPNQSGEGPHSDWLSDDLTPNEWANISDFVGVQEHVSGASTQLPFVSGTPVSGELVFETDAIRGSMEISVSYLVALQQGDVSITSVLDLGKVIAVNTQSSESTDELINIEVAGTWQCPVLRAPELRQVVMEGLIQQAEPELQSQLAALTTRLHGEFYGKLETLETQSQKVSDRQAQLSGGSQKQLLATREKLENRLIEIDGALVR